MAFSNAMEKENAFGNILQLSDDDWEEYWDLFKLQLEIKITNSVCQALEQVFESEIMFLEVQDDQAQMTSYILQSEERPELFQHFTLRTRDLFSCNFEDSSVTLTLAGYKAALAELVRQDFMCYFISKTKEDETFKD